MPYGSVYVCMANIILEAMVSLGVTFCKFVTKWAKVFKLIFSLTYSLLPPRVCIDKMWNEFENMLRQCAQLSVLRW